MGPDVTLRLGFLGCGFITALHSRAVAGLIGAGLVDASVVACGDVDPVRAERVGRALGASVMTTSAVEVLAAVDAVWVCTPTSSHRGLVEAACEAGVAVFCEKPLATTLADAEVMADAVATAGVAAQVGLVLRTAPAYAALVEVVRSGALGRPMAAVLRDDQYWPTQGQYASTWRGDVDVAGGGTLLEHSVHDLDVLRWLLGEVRSVAGTTAGFAGVVGVEDLAVATLRFESGAVASLTSVWHQVLSRPSSRSLEVFCEHGLASVVGDEFDGPLVVQTDAGVDSRACTPPGWVADLPIEERWHRYAGHYAPQALQFLSAVDGTGGRGPGLEVAVAAHRLADATYRSAALGGAPVEVA